MKIQGAKVFRGGVTSPYLNLETTSVNISVYDGAIRFEFTMSSKGGGETHVKLQIDGSGFQNVLEEMTNADRQAAMNSMSNEVACQLKQYPSHIENVKKAARQEVQDLAQEKYIEAPAGNDDIERIICDGATKLVNELNVNQTGKKAA